MLILGLESSCDETAAAVVKDGRIVLSSVIASQVDVHREFGGVVPEIASREHLRAIDATVNKALADGKVMLQDIDAIAVTQGPGLIGALLVAVSYGKGLAIATGKPLIPVDHVHGHIHGGLLENDWSVDTHFPAIALVVSGGHTNLYWMESPVTFKLLGSTIDDACGESFDKVGKLLGMPYPGGPYIEKAAADHATDRYPMPKMIEEKARLEFSYSGLKTHMVNLIRKLDRQGNLAEEAPYLCGAFQEAAIDQLIRKLESAVSSHPGAKSVVIAGGVAANGRFKKMMAERIRIPVLFPKLKYCADNAAMIAAYGYFRQELESDKSDFASLDWDAYSRYRYEDV